MSDQMALGATAKTYGRADVCQHSYDRSLGEHDTLGRCTKHLHLSSYPTRGAADHEVPELVELRDHLVAGAVGVTRWP